MDLPQSFSDRTGDEDDTCPANRPPTSVTVRTGRLFLDYADVAPHSKCNGEAERIRGEPSRSECTSSTASVVVPGLRLIEDYVSEREEAVLMAALTGPHAPWAPPQRTPSGGRIQRRVQHFGYVFDYESADVLRRGEGGSIDGDGDDRSACPPLPAMASSRVTRLNQLTINEYSTGQGIGSHVDTETAFDDELLVVTLNGGIVMEFRRVPERADAQDDGNGRGDGDSDGARKLLYLPPRSLLLLSGDARYKWEHMIVSRTTDTVDGTVLPRRLRVSLTLRTALTAPAPGRKASSLPLYETAMFPPGWGQPSDAGASEAEGPEAASTAGQSDPWSDLVTPATERRHVHEVYDAIAAQWHHTRGKRGVAWPGATRFLEDLPPGSVVADVGCGDGKYFPAIWASGSYVVGTDISEPLLRTAAAASTPDGEESGGSGRGGGDGPQHRKLSTEKRALGARPAVAVADCIHLPLRSGSCDAAICIAVMHHLSTEGRRLRCLSELRRIVRRGGLINVQAWALEQEDDGKRRFHGTDLLVPFNAQPKYLQASGEAGRGCEEARPGAGVSGGTKGVAQMMAERYGETAAYDSKKNLVVFQRYCHMYRRGELESLCERVPGLEVVESFYEKGNHAVLLRVLDNTS
ncbi:hypothetical protein ACHAWF_011657 [Thalassiosira exigua]